ncbi:MAG: SPOR domain-containing protein [Pseudomonadota bacterium]
MSEQDRTAFPAGTDDFDTFDATDEEGGLPGLVVLVMAVLVLVAFGAVVWIAYQQGLKEGGSSAPPLVVADPGPSKIERSGASGSGLDDDREVFDRITDDPPNREEALTGGEEEPDRYAFLIDETEEAVEAPSTTPSAQPIPPARRPERLAPLSAPSGSVASNAGAATTPAPEPVVVAPEPEPKPASVLPGDYVVQIASLKSESEAELSWTKLKARFPSMMTSVGPNIQQADLGARGVYYRLRVGPFAEKSEADEFCRVLKARGQDCIVRKS